MDHGILRVSLDIYYAKKKKKKKKVSLVHELNK